jgi:hypothetical protein
LSNWPRTAARGFLILRVLPSCSGYVPWAFSCSAVGLAQKFKLSKFNVELVSVKGKSKFERLEPHVELIRSGRILLDASSVDREEFIDELVQFLLGNSDDQVDAMTQYLEFVATHALPPRRQRTIGSIRQSTKPFWS